MLRRAERVVCSLIAAADGDVGIAAREPTGAKRRAATQTIATTSREELDDAGHRIGPVQHTRRAANDLDAIEVVDGEGGEIECAAGIVHRNPIDEDLRVLALAAADEERRRAAVRSRLHQ